MSLSRRQKISRTPTKSEQKLVNIAIELVLVHRDYGKNLTRDETIEWIIKQLDSCGYKGHPVGLLHHYITEVLEYETD